MKFELTILGCGSALPTLNRRPTSQVLNIHEKYFLIDCGEGTQIQIRKYKINFQRINQIFISHLHGDHYLGLCGLISSYHLLGRTAPLQIFSPTGLKEIIELQFLHSQTYLKFPIEFIVLDHKQNKTIFEDKQLTVQSFPLKHRIPCYGFLFKEKIKPKNIIKDKIKQYNIPIPKIPKIKAGEDFIMASGKVVSNNLLTMESPPIHSYAYCSDTAYSESILPYIKHCTLLYHEATFCSDLKDRAKKTYHSTAHDAANIARKSNVGKLIIGHYSARYKDSEQLLTEAKEIFKDSIAADEGMVIRLY